MHEAVSPRGRPGFLLRDVRLVPKPSATRCNNSPTPGRDATALNGAHKIYLARSTGKRTAVRGLIN